jgi:hypothetical protein
MRSVGKQMAFLAMILFGLFSPLLAGTDDVASADLLTPDPFSSLDGYLVRERRILSIFSTSPSFALADTRQKHRILCHLKIEDKYLQAQAKTYVGKRIIVTGRMELTSKHPFRILNVRQLSKVVND